ncbi:MAG: hypothetical protein ACFBSC_00125 [Microcoleaceae cyanobacterium]
MTLQEIEIAIQHLSEYEARQLMTWFQNYLDEQWDRQIEADLLLGKLDKLIARAERDILDNEVRDLNEVLPNA